MPAYPLTIHSSGQGTRWSLHLRDAAGETILFSMIDLKRLGEQPIIIYTDAGMGRQVYELESWVESSDNGKILRMNVYNILNRKLHLGGLYIWLADTGERMVCYTDLDGSDFGYIHTEVIEGGGGGQGIGQVFIGLIGSRNRAPNMQFSYLVELRGIPMLTLKHQSETRLSVELLNPVSSSDEPLLLCGLMVFSTLAMESL